MKAAPAATILPFAWTATATEGLQLDPSEGRLDVQPGADGQVDLTVTAADDAATGCALVVLGLRGVPDGESMPAPVIGINVLTPEGFSPSGCE